MLLHTEGRLSATAAVPNTLLLLFVTVFEFISNVDCALLCEPQFQQRLRDDPS
jgi:hypothetical protein